MRLLFEYTSGTSMQVGSELLSFKISYVVPRFLSSIVSVCVHACWFILVPVHHEMFITRDNVRVEFYMSLRSLVIISVCCNRDSLILIVQCFSFSCANCIYSRHPPCISSGHPISFHQ